MEDDRYIAESVGLNMLELLVRIEKILDRTGKLNKILRYRDITIDTEKRTVTKSGEAIPLQPLEFDLFVMLVNFKNCTLSRERILNEIWGMDFLGARTVDTHIANLRKLHCFQRGLCCCWNELSETHHTIIAYQSRFRSTNQRFSSKNK